MGPLIEERDSQKPIAESGTRRQTRWTPDCGGKRAEGRGYFFEPTLLTDTDNNMDIMKEETADPVLPVSTFDTLDQVIALANDGAIRSDQLRLHFTNPQRSLLRHPPHRNSAKPYINRENFEAMQGFHAGWKIRYRRRGRQTRFEEYLQTQVVYLETNV